MRPGWVPAGIVSRTRPFGVPTWTAPPSSASFSVSGSSRSRSAPRRVNVRSFSWRTTTNRSPPPGALPVKRMRRAGIGALRDLDLEPLAIDFDQTGRAVIGLVEGDLRDGFSCRLGGRGGRARRPTGRTAVRVEAHAGEDVLEPRPTGRPPAATWTGVLERLGCATEERLEEVAEIGVAGCVELVADIPALPTEPGEAGERVACRAAGIGAGGAGTGRGARPGVGLPVLAESVVQRPLVRIGQHGVGLVHGLELLLRFDITLVRIGVVLPGGLAEGLLDVGL